MFQKSVITKCLIGVLVRCDIGRCCLMMRRFRSLVVAALATMLCVCLASCWSKSGDTGKMTRLTMAVGETKALDIQGLGKDFTWESQYESVAVVSADGEVVAKSPGKTTITVKAGGKEYQFVVVVKDGDAAKEDDAEDSSKEKDADKKKDASDDKKKDSDKSDAAASDDAEASDDTSTDDKKVTLSGGPNSGVTERPEPSTDPNEDDNDGELTGAEKRAKEREQAGQDAGGGQGEQAEATQDKLPKNNQPVLYVDDVTAKAGNKDVKLAVKVLRNPGILGMSFAVHFDESVLTLTKAENGSALSDVLDLTAGKKLEDGCKFAWDGVEISSDQIKDGDVLVLTFDVSGSAKAGTHEVSIACDEGDIVNGKLVPVDIQLVAGGITVK